MSLASRWTLTPDRLCEPGKTGELLPSATADRSELHCRSSEKPLVVRLVHESAHADVIHNAQSEKRKQNRRPAIAQQR